MKSLLAVGFLVVSPGALSTAPAESANPNAIAKEHAVANYLRFLEGSQMKYPFLL